MNRAISGSQDYGDMVLFCFFRIYTWLGVWECDIVFEFQLSSCLHLEVDGVAVLMFHML